jgi:hypothetical protein
MSSLALRELVIDMENPEMDFIKGRAPATLARGVRWPS